MIRIQGLGKSFGSIRAVENVSFEIDPGSLTILAGADGAGKSTILKILIGLIKKDKGEIFLKNESIGEDFTRITRICGYMPERFSLYTDLSVEENLNFFADIHQVPRQRKESLKHRLLEKTGMLPFRKRRAGALSGGMKQKLALSAILLSSPEIIILDEPTTGVDPLSRIEFFNIIEELKGEGKTVIVSTPYLDEAEKGDEIIFIKKGRVLLKGPIMSLKENFPATVYKILPRGNILEIIQDLSSRPEIKDDFFVRGRHIKYMQRGAESFLETIPSRKIERIAPTLEDIYLYHERTLYAGDGKS